MEQENVDGGEAASKTEQNQPELVTKQDLQSVMAELANLKGLVTPKETPKAEAPVITPELAKILAADPVQAAQFWNSQLNNLKTTVHSEIHKDQWDRKTEAEYPQLLSDAKFKQEVINKITELTNSGEYTKNSPMLVYRAAQLAAAKYPLKTAPQGAAIDGNAPRKGGGNQQTKTTVDDNDPRVAMAKIMGVKDIEKFKKQLPPIDDTPRVPKNFLYSKGAKK